MKNNWFGRRTPRSLVWPAMFLGAGGLWFCLAQGGGVTGPLGAAALVLTALLGIGWLSRVRASRRLNAALDAYAEREIDRERRRKGPHQVRGVSTRAGVLSGESTHERRTTYRREEPFPTRAADDVPAPRPAARPAVG
jgi:hypothetical protein